MQKKSVILNWIKLPAEIHRGTLQCNRAFCTGFLLIHGFAKEQVQMKEENIMKPI